jgi:hypothetical protein
VLWIAGEGEDDLPGMIEAVAKEHGLDWKKLPISICFEAVNFADRGETDKLIEKLKGMGPMLITADALADIMAAGEKDEDKSKDITLVYKNVRRVEKKTGSVFLIPHHEGWNGDHERGSTAIRANSDILVRIIEFKADKGYIKFTHKKRRGGPMLKQFAYEVKLVQVERCKHLVPVVTGKPVSIAGLALNENWTAAEEGARELVRLVMEWPTGEGKPTYDRLMERSGMASTTFQNARAEAVKVREWLVGGGKGGYRLNENECWKEALADAPRLTPSLHPTSDTYPTSDTSASYYIGGRRQSEVNGTSNLRQSEAIGGKGSTTLPTDDQAAEALALTLDTEALLRKSDKR